MLLSLDFFPVSIHASHVGGDYLFDLAPGLEIVSIHASHVGGDLISTLICEIPIDVSIHASHVGGDLHISSASLKCARFNPRLPRRRRHDQKPRHHQ